MPRILAPPAPIDITDPLRRELTLRYRSESKADSIRPVITADMVSQDTDGLIDLIVSSKNKFFLFVLSFSNLPFYFRFAYFHSQRFSFSMRFYCKNYR